jgi:hypothetical protein
METEHLISSSIRTGLKVHDDSSNIGTPTSYYSIKIVILARVFHMSKVGKRQCKTSRKENAAFCPFPMALALAAVW